MGGTLAFTFCPENVKPKRSKGFKTAVSMGISFFEEQQLIHGSDLSKVISILKSMTD